MRRLAHPCLTPVENYKGSKRSEEVTPRADTMANTQVVLGGQPVHSPIRSLRNQISVEGAVVAFDDPQCQRRHYQV